MAKNRFRRNAANCMTLAKGIEDLVLSYGYRKMAEAWRDLDKRRGHSNARHGTRRRSSTHPQHNAARERPARRLQA
jgi:hypothetical protein